MSNEPRRGLLFVVSAPSGTGKTTLVEQLVRLVPDLTMSRSYTSRPPRAGECDGVDYNFVTRARFEDMIAAGDFLEWAEVFGNLYGTCRSDTEALLARGRDVVLVIDVQGGRQVRKQIAGTISVFVLPPSFEVLERRLRGRCKDPEDAILRRLATARREVQVFSEYDYLVINDEFDRSVDCLRSIVIAERSRLGAVRPQADIILESFTRKVYE